MFIYQSDSLFVSNNFCITFKILRLCDLKYNVCDNIPFSLKNNMHWSFKKIGLIFKIRLLSFFFIVFLHFLYS